MKRKINDILLKEAENDQERVILGFLSETAKHIQYGKIKLEITVHKGKMTNTRQDIDGASVIRSINLHDLS